MFDRALPAPLADLLKHELHLPVCPTVFIRLAEALEHADDGNFDLAKILSADPTLTSQVLRVANSAFYGVPRQVNSLYEAILRIGLTEIWSIAAALKAKEMFKNQNGEWSFLNRLLWEHALKTAAAARCVVRQLKVQNADELFTAALLHDLGKLLLNQIEPQYMLLCQNGVITGAELTLREMDFFGTHHARLGGELLLHWNLPEPLALLVARHHEEPDPAAPDRKLHNILAVANQIAHALSESSLPGEPALTRLLPETLLDSVGLDMDASMAIAEDAQTQFGILNSP